MSAPDISPASLGSSPSIPDLEALLHLPPLITGYCVLSPGGQIQAAGGQLVGIKSGKVCLIALQILPIVLNMSHIPMQQDIDPDTAYLLRSFSTSEDLIDAFSFLGSRLQVVGLQFPWG